MFRRSLYLLIVALWTAACIQETKAPEEITTAAKEVPEAYVPLTSTGDTIPTGVPIPAVGKRIERDGFSQATVVPLKGKPRVTPAHPNVHPAGKPKVVPVPKELTVIIPGQNGVPMPETVPANGKVVSALQPKPVPALAPVMSKSAATDIRYLDVEQGMSSSVVWDMLEDNHGNLWFATNKGVSKYDGTSFTHYTKAEGLSSDRVSSLLEDRWGNIWIGTDEGEVNKYDGVNFTHYGREEGLKVTRVMSMLEDRQGNLWFGTIDEGVVKFEPDADQERSEGRFTYYTGKEGLPGSLVSTILEDSLGHLWFGTQRGLTRYEPAENDNGGVFTHFTVQEGSSNGSIKSLLKDSRGNIWIGTQRGGVIKYDGINFFHFTTGQGLSNNYVGSILEDSRGDLWFGTFGGGVNRFDPDANGGQGSFQQLTQEEGLSANPVSSMLEDSRGNIWFGTFDGGLNRLSGGGYIKFDMLGDESSAVSVVSEDRLGNIWFGGMGTGAICYDELSFTHYTTEEGLSSDEVYSIIEDSRGNLLIGTRGGKLNRFNGTSFTHYAKEKDVSGNTVFSMLEDSRGNLWVGSWADGVSRYDPDANNGQGSLIHFTTEEGLIDRHVRSMIEDKRGNIWIATDYGVSRYDPDANNGEGSFFNYTTKEGLSNNKVYSILEDSRGDFWFGTHGAGVSRYDPDANNGQGSFTYYTERNGLIDNTVIAIIEDEQKNIWVSTTGGITLLIPLPNETGTSSDSDAETKGYRLFNLSKEESFYRGLFDISPQVVYLDRQNRMWWGTVNGVTMLDLDKFELPATTPDIRLNTIDVAQTFVDYRRLSDPAYRDSLTFGKTLAESFDSVAPFHNYPITMALPHHLDHLTFHFSAIDWAAPHKLRYTYIVEGLDEKWSPLSPESKADYRNLPAGDYIFKVKAIGAADQWSKIFEYPFRIRSPWYAAWWMLLLYGALGGYLLYLLYRFLLARQLERSEIVRLQELDAFKTRLYTNITHEFRTPLTIILGMARQIKDDPQKWLDEGLQMIVRNGRQLLNLVNQMLDLSKLDKGKLQLKPQPGDIVGFMRYLIQSFESFAAGKQIQLHFLNKMDRLDLEFDPDQLTKVVSNLLANALKFTPEGGHVYVTLQNQRETLELSVRDTGPGIPAAEQSRIFDRFYQIDDSATRSTPGAGVGLALARELVQLMSGEIQVQSTPGAGAEFSVRLPIQRAVPEAVAQFGVNLRSRSGTNYPQTLTETPVSESSPTRAAATSSGEQKRTATAIPDAEQPVVLLIEDDRDVLTYLASCLEGSYQLEFARNGREGVQRALEIVPDLIVSDIMMPEKDGYELCATLKEDIRTSHIPIVLLTAKADQGSRILGLKSGADAYLAKPFDKEELEVRLERLLALRRQLQASYGQLNAGVSSRSTPYPTRESRFLSRLREAVEAHLADESFGVAQLCEVIHLSRGQLHNKLKALTGGSASLFIRAVRLEKSKELLRSTDLNISEVAYEVGFRTPTYFTQAFTEVVGMAPSAFRRELEG